MHEEPLFVILLLFFVLLPFSFGAIISSAIYIYSGVSSAFSLFTTKLPRLLYLELEIEKILKTFIQFAHYFFPVHLNYHLYQWEVPAFLTCSIYPSICSGARITPP